MHEQRNSFESLHRKAAEYHDLAALVPLATYFGPFPAV